MNRANISLPMRDNEKVRLVGSAVELVPYERIFVERYHQWMQDAFLLDMTASEPLTIEQEYEMQTSWREDPDKCTFILLSKKNESGEVGDDEVNRMIGDVNLFVSQRFYEWVGEDQVEREEKNAEVDIMVAEKTSRGRGIGVEAVKLMLWYGARHLEISRFFAKINKSNEPSIKLFRR